MGYKPNFTTERENLATNNRVFVNSLNAFPEPVAGVITLTNGINYIFTNTFSLGDNQFRIPTGGQVEFQANSELLSPIQTTVANGTPLFIGDYTRLVIREVDFINLTGTGKFVATEAILSPSSTFVFRRCFIIGFADIGEVNGAFTIWNNVVFVNCGAGVSLTNSNLKRAGIAWGNVQFVNVTGTYASIYDTMQFIEMETFGGEPATGSSVLYIDPSLIILSQEGNAGNGIVNFHDSLFNDASGGTMFAAGSLDQTDPRFLFTNTFDHPDSFIIGSMGFKESSAITTIGTINTYVDINGTFLDVHLERFTRSGGELTYTGVRPVTAIAEVSITAMRDSPSSSGRIIRAAVFVDSGVGFIEQNDSFSMTILGTPINLSFQVPIGLLLETDKVKVQIKNEDTTDDIVVVDYNLTVNVA